MSIHFSKKIMKQILIINGHPRKDSFNFVIAETYKKSAIRTGVSVKVLNVIDLEFEAFQTKFKDYDAPKDIINARGLIAEADHIVWVYPIWWYSMPAILKAFIEQTFVSGFAFEYLKSDKILKWNKLLKNKTFSIISTMDAPPLFYKTIIKDAGGKFLKESMKFCGMKFKSRIYFGSVKLSSEEQRKKWLTKIEIAGKNHK